jgi:cytochrome P450 PksS
MESTVPDIPSPNFASAEFKADPYLVYARLRDEAPVYRTTRAGRQTAWLVTRYDDALAVLKDERLSKDRLAGTAKRQMHIPFVSDRMRPLAMNMLDRDGADHRRLRALVQQAFTPRLVEQLRGRVQELCDELLDAMPPDGRMDLLQTYALPLPVTIIAEMLGIPPADRRRFVAWSNHIVAVSSGADLVRGLPQVILFMRYLRRLIAERRAEPRDDLVSALVRAEEAGDVLSEDELLAMVFLLLVAGYETTVNLIASGTLALLQHPEQCERLRADPELAKSAVEELLRFTSPVDMATERYTRAELTLGEVTIPAGEMVLAVLGSANRDERQFADPDTLDLAREPNRHLAFGQGIHYCVGAPLARIEGQIALTTLLDRLPNLRLAVEPGELRWRRGLFLRGLAALPVRT